MNCKGLNVPFLKKYILNQSANVTCINCCKYYVVPTTATCGHSLCRTCWIGRRSCPSCASQVVKTALKLNPPLQSLTEHTVTLRHAFETLFNTDLDNFIVDSDEQQHVKEWLANSENQFSAPTTDSQQLIEGIIKPVQQITSEAQIHTINQKVKPSERETIIKNVKQDDWDKIEKMPETENPVGPMDIETFDFFIDDKDYDVNNPRRSSRNRDLKNSKPPTSNDIVSDKESSKNCNISSDKITNKNGPKWKNVNRMKKEFSKLNKKNRNKLNISIDMCKKTKLAAKNDRSYKVQEVSCDIVESTPVIAAVGEILTENVNVNSHNEISTGNFNKLPGNNRNSLNNAQDNIAIANMQQFNQNDFDSQKKPEESIPINKNETTSKVSFFKRGPINTTCIHTNKTHFINIDNLKNKGADGAIDTENIEIIIKIGKVMTNICIQKKENEVQFKKYADCEVQTTLGNLIEDKNKTHYTVIDSRTGHIQSCTNKSVVKIFKDVSTCTQQDSSKPQIEKSVSTKKNTTSADTSTAHFEITESQEKEFADQIDNITIVNNQCKNNSQNSFSKSNLVLKENNMEKVLFLSKQEKIYASQALSSKFDSSISNNNNNVQHSSKNLAAIPEDLEFSNDLDIFEGDSVKAGTVKPLESVKGTSSVIIMPKVKNNPISQKNENKRAWETHETDRANNKKMKIVQKSNVDNKKIQENCPKVNPVLDSNSDNINYDAIMSQVFANIRTDMENFPKASTEISNTQKISNEKNSQAIKSSMEHQQTKNKTSIQKTCDETIQKCSENVFSLLEKDNINSEIFTSSFNKPQTQLCKDPENLAPDKVLNVDVENIENPLSDYVTDIAEFGTPMQDDDDKSIVEETPQKHTSFLKYKSKNESKILAENADVANSLTKKQKSTENNKEQKDSSSVISISDAICEVTEIHQATLETPLTINKFVDKILYKSTPIARKSLKFSSRHADNDIEDTMCPSSEAAAETTQERDFMSKAFEQTLEPLTQGVPAGKQRGRRKFCVAGSCLIYSEQAMVKELCLQLNWTFVDKYTEEMTHLVVGVDEENKAQRSVKYVCALASSKWIVSFAWVEKCLLVKGYVDEEPFEALDATGEPGPRRSRLSKTKLLQGISFYCMEPFSIISPDTLKDILEAAGGRVIRDAGAQQTYPGPAMLLAEPQHTQENRILYRAMELKMVPMNYEWALNCLGMYSLRPIYDQLLCPEDLLPSTVAEWPAELISTCSE